MAFQRNNESTVKCLEDVCEAEYLGVPKIEIAHSFDSMSELKLPVIEKSPAGGQRNDAPAAVSLSSWMNKMVVLPDSPKLPYWDVVMLACLVWVAAVTPWETAFLELRLGAVFACNRILDLLFVFDLILQFFLAVPNSKGRLLKQRAEIVQNYLYGWFLPDLVFVLPYDMISYMFKSAGGGSLDILRVLRVLKMFRLLRGQRIFTRMEDRYAINYALVQLCGYLLMLIGLCHWLACGWYLMIVLERNQECTWSYVHEFDNQGVWACCTNWFDCYPFRDFSMGNTLARQYFLALTWAAGEVLTVGSDIAATTDAERTFMLLARVVSGVVYAYLLGAVCSIFTMASKDKNEYFQNMDMLNKFLTEHALTRTNAELCQNLRRFYRFSFKSAAVSNSFDHIANSISPLLRGQLAYEVHAGWLKRLPFLEDSDLDSEFYVALSLELTSQLFAPLEIIIDLHHAADKVFIVDKGVVLAQGAPKTLGDSFGLDAISAFRNGQKRGYQAISFTHGSVFILQCESITELMHRPQYKRACQAVLQRLTRMRLRELMLYLVRTFKAIAQINQDFDAACNALRDELSFVKEAAMPQIIEIFKWHHHNVHNTMSLMGTKLRCRSVKGMKDERDVEQILEVETILAAHRLESLAPRLVVDEQLSLKHLIKMNPEQLHQVGFPMGVALDFVEKWDKYTLEECQTKLFVDEHCDVITHTQASKEAPYLPAIAVDVNESNANRVKVKRPRIKVAA